MLFNDTLNKPIAISNYTGALELFDNAFNADVSVADALTQANGTNYIDGTFFGKRLTLVHQSPNAPFYEGYGSPAGNGNVVKGRDSIVNLSTAATLYLSYTHPHRADSTMTLNGTATMNIPSLSFGGSGNGFLRNDAQAALSVPTLNIQKTGSSSLIVQAPLTVTNTVNFTSGYIRDSSIAPLTFASGAGDGSHVVGPVVKAGNQAFTFPLGNGAYYSSAGISAPQSTSDAFTARFFPYQPGIAGYDSSLHDASINHISRAEFCTINRTAGTSNVQVTLGYNRPASGAVTAMNDLTVVHWYNNGTSLAWHDEGNGGTSGTNAQGTITISSFSPFTLASITVANPLPVKITAFDAMRVNHTAALSWTAAEESGIEGYGIQRSSDGSTWTTLATVPAHANGAAIHAYAYTDGQPAAGRNFYRLQLGDRNGGIRSVKYRP